MCTSTSRSGTGWPHGSGPTRAELMRLAAQRELEAPGTIEQAVNGNREIFRSEKNRAPHGPPRRRQACCLM